MISSKRRHVSISYSKYESIFWPQRQSFLKNYLYFFLCSVSIIVQHCWNMEVVFSLIIWFCIRALKLWKMHLLLGAEGNFYKAQAGVRETKTRKRPPHHSWNTDSKCTKQVISVTSRNPFRICNHAYGLQHIVTSKHLLTKELLLIINFILKGWC